MENDNKNITGLPYRMRLEILQRRYMGLLKNTSPRKPRKYVPGSEAERVYKEGRY